jgi:hypothetical protein
VIKVPGQREVEVMTRFATLALLLALGLFFTGCPEDNKGGTPPASNPQKPDAATVDTSKK